MTTPTWTRLVGACVALSLLSTACGDDSAAPDAADVRDATSEPAGAGESRTSASADEEIGAPPGDTSQHDTDVGDHEHDETDADDHEHDETDSAAVPIEETGTAAVDGLIEVAFVGGDVLVDDDRMAVALGSEVTLSIESDVAEHVHVHGYDLFVDVAPGSPATLTFTADVPGLFEVEFEDSVTFITELEVS